MNSKTENFQKYNQKAHNDGNVRKNTNIPLLLFEIVKTDFPLNQT